ncbi:hypothetical protein [Pengzhenrongella frigida]|uniref:Uncharacterized protein n=1 Tax=Pengzhenrongella frigida TaxID=1259133 RepID=A0A4Q5MZ16_9MICO|nr:hypothetical protein [Cellulomonas sp. HLT2-17]RYV50978.1 hypothetical protein EUA98_10750 [Cellulomonas sp. HLT2-17]
MAPWEKAPEEGSGTMNEFNAVNPTATWMQIIAILTAAADSPQTTAAGRPDLHSLALGAQIVASRAVALLPIDSDGDLEDIVLEVAGSSAVRELIRAAGHAARRYPVDEFPTGAAAVISELDDLVAESEAAS